MASLCQIIKPFSVLLCSLEEEAKSDSRNNFLQHNPSGDRIKVALLPLILGLHIVRIECNQLALEIACHVNRLPSDASNHANRFAVLQHGIKVVSHFLFHIAGSQPVIDHHEHRVFAGLFHVFDGDLPVVHFNVELVLCLLLQQLLEGNHDFSRARPSIHNLTLHADLVEREQSCVG